jgi:hypothetical protein
MNIDEKMREANGVATILGVHEVSTTAFRLS